MLTPKLSILHSFYYEIIDFLCHAGLVVAEFYLIYIIFAIRNLNTGTDNFSNSHKYTLTLYLYALTEYIEKKIVIAMTYDTILYII